MPATLSSAVTPTSANDISSAIYAAADVKKQLSTDQFSKCVYCESRLNGDYGHVEHFRPKGGYTIPPSTVLITPGYFWLAYDWDNLLLSCSRCNTSYKKNHFALVDESSRDIPNRDISREVALLVNPYAVNPNDYMEFHEYIIVPKLIEGRESRIGRYTIDLLHLNKRPDLVRNRQELWDKLVQMKRCLIIAKELITTGKDVRRGKELLMIAEDEINRMRERSAEYSGMFVYQKAI